MSADFEFDATETDVTREGGYDRPVPGEYMLVAKSLEETTAGGHPVFRFEFEVLSGEPKDAAAGDQKGKTFEQSFFLPNPMEPDPKKRARNANKLSRLGLATEAITVEGYTKPLAAEGKRIIKVDWDDTLGRPFCAKVSPGYKDEKFVEIAWAEDIWHVASARSKDVPKDAWTMQNVPMAAECPFARIKAIEEARKNGHAATIAAPAALAAPAAPAAPADDDDVP